jgi:manganese efflux pump family protein
MELFAVLGTAVGLAMDAFAVALASSVALHPVSRRQVFRFSFHFGLFQALMPMLGWLAGWWIQPLIASWDHWIAFALLAAVGCKAIYEAVCGDGDSQGRTDPTRGWRLVALSLATSIDAFVVGLSFAMLRVDIWYPAAVIGVITALLTCVGILVGGHIGGRFGRRMEIAGGIVLIAIGLRIVLQHV